MKEMCFVWLQESVNKKGEAIGRVGIIKWNEHGYYQTNYPNNFTKEMVDEMNQRLGVDQDEAEAMHLLSFNPLIEGQWECKYDELLRVIKTNRMKGNK